MRAKLGLPDPVRPAAFPLWGRFWPTRGRAGSASRAHSISSRPIGAPGCGSVPALPDPPVEVRDGPLIQGDGNFLHHTLSMTKHPTFAQRGASPSEADFTPRATIPHLPHGSQNQKYQTNPFPASGLFVSVLYR